MYPGGGLADLVNGTFYSVGAKRRQTNIYILSIYTEYIGEVYNSAILTVD